MNILLFNFWNMLRILKQVVLYLLEVKLLQAIHRFLEVPILLVLRSYLVIDAASMSLECLKNLLMRILQIAIVTDAVREDF